MAEIWLPGKHPLARSARGWPASPNIQPQVKSSLDYSNKNAVQHFVLANKPGTLYDISEYGRDAAQGGQAGGLVEPTAVQLIWDDGRAIDKWPFIGYPVGADWATSQIFSGASKFTILAKLKWYGTQSAAEDCIIGAWGQSVGGLDQVLFRYDSTAQQIESYFNDGSSTYSGNTPLTRTQAAQWNWIGLSYDGSELKTWINGVANTIASPSGVSVQSGANAVRWGLYAFDYIQGNSSDGGRFLMEAGLITRDALPEKYFRDPYSLLQPANQTPYLVGVSGAAPVGTLYWAVYPSGQADPTATEIINGTVPNGIFGTDTAPTIDEIDFTGTEIIGLTPNTGYKLAGVWNDTVDTSNVDITAEWFTLSDLITLLLQNTEHSHTVDNIDLLQKSILTVNDTSHSQTVDNIDLVSKGILDVNDTSHSQTVDNIDLVSKGILDVNDTSHSQTVDNIELVSEGALDVSNTEHSHTVDNIELQQAYLLVVQNAIHNHLAQNVTLISEGQLGVDDTEHTHTVVNVDLTQDNILQVANTEHLHAAENVLLSVTALLDVQNTEHVLFSPDIKLELEGSVVPNDTFHGHSVDNIELTQSNTIIVQGTEHLHSVENIDLSQGFTLIVDNTEHAHLAENIDLVSGNLLDIQNAVHQHFAENIDLTQQQILIVSNTVHQHLVDNIILPGTFFSAGRLVVVNSIGKRLVYIASTDRIVYVMRDS